MPFGRDIQKQIENALYEYNKLSDDNIFKKHINLAMQYFKDRPHLTVMTDFYFMVKKNTFIKKGFYYAKIYEKIGYEERQVQRMGKDIITRIVITLAIDGFFEL